MIDSISRIATFIFDKLLQRYREKRVLSDQFEALKNKIIYETLMNNFSVYLADLRGFFVEHGLVERPEFKDFFNNWLVSPILSMRQPVLGLFTNEQIIKMKTELSGLKI